MIPNLWLYCNHPNLMREITPPPEFYSTQESKLTPAYTLHFGHWIMDPMVHTSWAYGSNGQRWFWMNRYAITWFSFKLNRKKWLYMCLKVEWMNSYSLLDNVLQKSGVFFFPKSKMSLTRIIPFLHPSFSWWAIHHFLDGPLQARPWIWWNGWLMGEWALIHLKFFCMYMEI